MTKAYDKTGREIMVGDVLKVYHFTAALRRKKHYMYKHVISDGTFRDGTPFFRGLSDFRGWKLSPAHLLSNPTQRLTG
jgi:hypothetical protein